MRRHRTDLVSLVAGGVFLAVAIAAWNDALSLRILDAGWLWPAVLIGTGLALLAGIAGSDDEPASDPAGDAPPDPEWDPTDGDG